MESEPPRLRRKDTVRAPFKTFPEWTSTHGIPQIGRTASSSGRARWCCVGFWTVVTIVGLGLMIWQTTLIFVRYYRHEVSVQTALRFEQRPFPAVTLCSLNPYKKCKMPDYPNATRLLDTYLYVMRKVACMGNTSCFDSNKTLDEYQEMYGFVDIKDSATLQTKAKRLLNLEISQYDYTGALVELDDVVQSCSFNTEKCDMDIDWSSYVDPIMGQCFTFNTDSHRMSSKAGPYYGLRLIIRTNSSDNLITSDQAGVRVMIHDQQQYPFPDIAGYNIHVGRATSIGVQFHTVNRLGEPYGNCSDAKPAGYLYDLNYGTEGCQRSRYQAAMIAACNCFDPAFPKPSDDVPMCKIPDNFDCWNATVRQLEPDETQCVQPCHESEYQGTVSLADWPAGPVTPGRCERLPANETCKKYYQKNGALVEIYYEKLNYETMDESPNYSVCAFLAIYFSKLFLVQHVDLGFRRADRPLAWSQRHILHRIRGRHLP
ncbi:Protein DEL-4, partial [Aphelenchoides avenae]